MAKVRVIQTAFALSRIALQPIRVNEIGAIAGTSIGSCSVLLAATGKEIFSLSPFASVFTLTCRFNFYYLGGAAQNWVK
jgi:hypothetical protein